MSTRILAFAAALLLTFNAHGREAVAVDPAASDAASKVFDSIEWTTSGRGQVKRIASIDVPPGYMFARAKDVPKLMELMENPVSGKEVGFIAPEDMSWFMVFEFDPVGYVKDDDRDKLDADEILASIKQGTTAANQERKERGWAPLLISGWEQQPKYDPASNNLVWAVRAISESEEVVNYNTRILGREGVMEVALVCSPEQLRRVVPTAQRLLKNYDFNSGQRYAEFRQGDKIAEYGLAALITGGGIAVAAKTGLLAKLLKLLTKFGIFIAAAAAALWKKLSGKKETAY